MIRIQRHQLGPRCFVLGRRVHECHLGLLVLAGVAAAALAGALRDELLIGLSALGLWLLVKDWRDLFPTTRDTAAWRLGIHRRFAALRTSPRGDWLPPLAATAAAVTGVVNVVSALTPNIAWRGHLLLQVEPVSAVPVFHALALPASAALLLTSVYLARRRRRAWQAAFAVLVALGAFDLLKGLDVEEALLSFGVAGLLWWGRDSFHVSHDPITLQSAAWRVPAIALGTATLAAGAATAVAPNGDGLPQIVRETVALLTWSRGPIAFHDELGWVPIGVELVSAFALVVVAYLVFRPLAAPRSLPDPEVRRAAAELVRSYGTDTLAFFKLRSDKHYLFSPDRRGFVGYRIENGVLLVSGDPVGSPDTLPGLVQEACRFGAARGLRIGAVGASSAMLPLWRQAGLRALYIGDEAIVDAREFSLEGRAIRKVRQSVSRLEKAGYGADLVPAEALDGATLAELEAVSARWRAGAPERGFSMAMDSLSGDRPIGCQVVVARDPDGAARGFIHLVPSYGRPAMSLSHMRRDPDTPNGLMEFLVVSAVELLRERGVDEVSLNFAAFARFVHAPANALERALGRLVAVANPYFQIESLYRFNAKFFPRWEPRYLVYEGAFGLPRTGLATLWVEGQLPKPRLARRGPRVVV